MVKLYLRGIQDGIDPNEFIEWLQKRVIFLVQRHSQRQKSQISSHQTQEKPFSEFGEFEEHVLA